MSDLSYIQRSYAQRLEEYIRDEAHSAELYAGLSTRCGGKYRETLRAMSGDEERHLRAMQTEYFLLTGSSIALSAEKQEGQVVELLRGAWIGDGRAAEANEREVGLCPAEEGKRLFLSQSADERRHREKLKQILANMLGM